MIGEMAWKGGGREGGMEGLGSRVRVLRSAGVCSRMLRRVGGC